MASVPRRFARIADRVSVPLLGSKRVVIVGVGTVGSQVARELANSGVGRMLFIDGDYLAEENLSRHVLPSEYIGMNKAAALALHLDKEIDTLSLTALPRYVDSSLSDDELDALLKDADVIVAATDDRATQRRVGRRALALDVCAFFPGLYPERGGEVFLQLGPSYPCFLCWDAFRPEAQEVRGVTALNADTLWLIQLTTHLIIGCLDADSEYARLLAPRPNEQPQQLFVGGGFVPMRPRPATWRPNCPSCAVGPAAHIAAAEVALREPTAEERAAREAQEQRAAEAAETFDRLRRTFGVAVLVEVACIVAFVVVSLVIVNGHIKQATGTGFTLTLVLLGLLTVGVANGKRCLSSYAELGVARRRLGAVASSPRAR